MTDPHLEALLLRYGFACQDHQIALSNADPYSPYGASSINESSNAMKGRFKAIEQYLETDYVRKV